MRIAFPVELRGFEPLTFSLRTRRATNCATAPSAEEKLPPDLTLSESGYLDLRRTGVSRLAPERSHLNHRGHSERRAPRPPLGQAPAAFASSMTSTSASTSACRSASRARAESAA